jgi:hypothetical protein
MSIRLAALAACVAVLAVPAVAEVKRSAADGFAVECRAEVALAPAAAWTRLVHVGDWWSSAHTYSGDAANLQLKARAGGAWRERWKGGEVEHGRVLMAMAPATLRLDAPLGPLQEMGVSAILTIQLTALPSGTTGAVFSYRVSGAAGLGLDSIAPAIDGVLCEQAARFARLT